MSKQDRQGVRTADELERKYNFGKRFAEILGIALDARDSVNAMESTLRDEILEQKTTMTRDTEQIVFEALKTYVSSDEFGEFKKTYEAELSVFAEGIRGEVSAATDRISNVDEDLQEKFNTITKYFTFDVDGLTIGQENNPNRVIIDNDEITIMVGNSPIQTFKADGTAEIPTVKITKSIDLMGLQFTEDETHINCDYVG